MPNPEPVKLVTVGTVALDTLHTPTRSAEELLGGSAAYFALAARYLSPAGIVGAVGGDFPESHLKTLKDHGVRLEGVEIRRDRKSFRWVGRYHEGLDRRDTIRVDLEIFDGYAPRVPEPWRKAPFLFLANGSPSHQLAVLDQAPGARCVVCDSMNLWIETDRKGVEQVFRRTHGVILNDEEAEQFTGTTNIVRAGRRIQELGPRFVLIKKGEHGSFLFSSEGLFLLPAYPLEEFEDPTGAGDTFAGGLMGMLAMRGRADLASIREGMVWGTVLASFCVETLGPGRLIEADRASVEKRLAEFRGMVGA